MDRITWQATVHRVAEIKHDLNKHTKKNYFKKKGGKTSFFFLRTLYFWFIFLIKSFLMCYTAFLTT